MTTSDYQQMLTALHNHQPSNPDVQRAIAALIRADRDGSEDLAVELVTVSGKSLPADVAYELRWHPSDMVRSRAWSSTGATASTEEWDRALAEETDLDVRDIMRMVAPIADWPDARVWALLGAERHRFTVASARNLVEAVGRAAGGERWWAAALAKLNPKTLPQSTIEDIEVSLTRGYATAEVLAAPDVHWLYRVFAGLSPYAPEGTLAALAAEVPHVEKLTENLSVALQRALFAAAASSMTDRRGLKVLCEAAGVLLNRPRDLVSSHLLETTDLAPDVAYADLLKAASKDTGEKGRRYAFGLWRSLPVEHRTDAVCTTTLLTFAYDQELCTEVLDFLGSRAPEVLADPAFATKMTSLLTPEPAAWIYTAAPSVWVRRIRHRSAWGDSSVSRHARALEAHEHLRDLVWVDMVENPTEWDDRAAGEAAVRLRLRREEWLQLPAGVLTAVVNRGDAAAAAAFEAISGALATVVRAAPPAEDVAGAGVANHAQLARAVALQHLCGPEVPIGTALSASTAVA